MDMNECRVIRRMLKYSVESSLNAQGPISRELHTSYTITEAPPDLIEATTDGIPASLPFPKKSFLKKQLYSSLSRWQAEGTMVRQADRSTALYRKYSNSCTGPENASTLATGHGPFPSYLKRFGLHSLRLLRMWGNRKLFTNATRCPLLYLITTRNQAPQFIVHWWMSLSENSQDEI
ncbi:hypothetical protein AVEN_183559-1 [Araneus ventricosus]|uniref:Uncharacterized protein n=1 Tax=Araneus ventricosus TaxID=182803 RepID=A0A4Y2FKV1_ARAVE|nr:hypothetical protein AVEN_183559-1 [Araneus ventricosus]